MYKNSLKFEFERIDLSPNYFSLSRQLAAVKASKLYKEIKRGQLPIVYHPIYNISFCGIERCHPFDSRKWGRVYETLLRKL